MDTALINIEHLRVSYKKRKIETEIFTDLNLKIYQGEFVGIMGKSGKGKSTLLNVISGLKKPQYGNVYVANREIFQFKTRELEKYRNQTIGHIFQDFRLIDELSVIENVMIPLIIKGEKNSLAREKAKKMLVEMNMINRINFYPKELSGGEKQRVAIARALINGPELLLADEPTGNLDKETKCEIMKLLYKINKKFSTIIMVTHDEECLQYFTRVIYL